MSTWGPSKRKSRQLSSRSATPAKRSSVPATSSSAGAKSAPASSARTGKRAQASAELRGAVQGREHEFLGIGLIVLGALLALALYLGLAGPLGRGINELFGWITGLARYFVPLALIVSGVALVRTGKSANPWRLAIGWGM